MTQSQKYKDHMLSLVFTEYFGYLYTCKQKAMKVGIIAKVDGNTQKQKSKCGYHVTYDLKWKVG